MLETKPLIDQFIEAIKEVHPYGTDDLNCAAQFWNTISRTELNEHHTTRVNPLIETERRQVLYRGIASKELVELLLKDRTQIRGFVNQLRSKAFSEIPQNGFFGVGDTQPTLEWPGFPGRYAYDVDGRGEKFEVRVYAKYSVPVESKKEVTTDGHAI